MAKGEYLSRRQKGIVKRYYEHMDTIQLQRLGEIVSDLYLTESTKKADQLWKRAEAALTKACSKKESFQQIVATRDIEGLARLVSTLTIAGKSTDESSTRSRSGGR